MREVCRLVLSLFIVAATFATAASCGGSGATTGVGLDASLGDGSGLHFGADGGGSHCKPGTCLSLGYTCGDNGDGCNGVLSCGTCEAGSTCGAGGFSKCGTGVQPTEAGPCTPKTCAD